MLAADLPERMQAFRPRRVEDPIPRTGTHADDAGETAVEIATVQLSADYAKGTVVNRLKDPLLAWPATAAKVGDHLLVVNTQFNTRGDNSQKTPFTLVRVPLARLAAR